MNQQNSNSPNPTSNGQDNTQSDNNNSFTNMFSYPSSSNSSSQDNKATNQQNQTQTVENQNSKNPGANSSQSTGTPQQTTTPQNNQQSEPPQVNQQTTTQTQNEMNTTSNQNTSANNANSPTTAFTKTPAGPNPPQDQNTGQNTEQVTNQSNQSSNKPQISTQQPPTQQQSSTPPTPIQQQAATQQPPTQQQTPNPTTPGQQQSSIQKQTPGQQSSPVPNNTNPSAPNTPQTESITPNPAKNDASTTSVPPWKKPQTDSSEVTATKEEPTIGERIANKSQQSSNASLTPNGPVGINKTASPNNKDNSTPTLQNQSTDSATNQQPTSDQLNQNTASPQQPSNKQNTGKQNTGGSMFGTSKTLNKSDTTESSKANSQKADTASKKENTNSNTIKFIIIGFVVLLVAGAIAYLAYANGDKINDFLTQSMEMVGLAENTEEPQNTQQPQTTQDDEALEDTKAENSLGEFFDKFSSGTYKVSDQGKIEYSYSQNGANAKSSMDYGQFTESPAYFENGEIKAVKDTETNSRYLMKDDTSYLIQDSEKSYYEMEALGEYLRMAYPITVIADNFREDSSQFEVIDENTYKWTWNVDGEYSEEIENPIFLEAELSIEPGSGMLEKLTIIGISGGDPDGETSYSGEVQFQYEEIDEIPAELLSIPEDYEETSAQWETTSPQE